MSQGIDYAGSFSTVNRDSDNGVRYGVISTGSLTEWFWDSVDQDYGKATCPECGNPTVEITSSHDDYKGYRSHGCADYACENCQHTLDSSDCFPEEALGWAIDDGEYKVIDCLDSDAMVIKSPFFTYAHFCSPCVPGACNLDSPVNPADIDPDTVKCYCFGHTWFDGDTAPYPVYSVETGKRIVSVREYTPCVNCDGTGRDTVKRLAAARQTTQKLTRSQINSGSIRVSDFDGADTFRCFRCDGKGTESQMVEREAQSEDHEYEIAETVSGGFMATRNGYQIGGTIDASGAGDREFGTREEAQAFIDADKVQS